MCNAKNERGMTEVKIRVPVLSPHLPVQKECLDNLWKPDLIKTRMMENVQKITLHFEVQLW
jgi:hypothetical protein